MTGLMLRVRLTAGLILVLLLAGCSQPESTGSPESSGNSESAGNAAEETKSSLVGEWTLSIDTPRGVQNPTLVVTQAAGSYAATYSSRQGSSLIEDVAVDGNQFSFPMELTIPIGTIEVRYVGEINGDQMQGFVENPRGQVAFSGTRSG